MPVCRQGRLGAGEDCLPLGGVQSGARLSFIGGVVSWVQANDNRWGAKVTGWSLWLLGDVAGEDGLHAIGNAVKG